MFDNNEVTRQAGNQYIREFLPAVLAYMVAIVLLTTLVDLETIGNWKYMVVLVPVAPMLWGARALIRHVGRMDEMERMIQLEGFSFGFGVLIIASVILGFLNIAGMDSHIWGHWTVFSLGMVGWGAGIARSMARR